MIKVTRTENTFPVQVKVEAGDQFREKITAITYVDYDEWIRLKLNCAGLGFQLSLEDAKRLQEVLAAAIRSIE